MHVLVAGFDLFRSVGGGQTFYRGVIARNPHVQFYYLRNHEPADVARPANAHPLTYREVYTHADLHPYAEPGPPPWTHHDFLTANNIAYAAAGRSFDVIDTPDYERFGVFLPGALRRHGVTYGKVALSMHGGLGTTNALNWQADGRVALSMQRLEHLQYQAADLRYFISRMYQDEWAEVSPLPSHMLDSMWFFSTPERQLYQDSHGPPSLHFIGRTERRKGPHLFLDVLWWLPRHTYSTASVIGPDSVNHLGATSSDFLNRMIDLRELRSAVTLVPAMSHAEMGRLFASKAVVFVPSIYDTLNLVALEALFSGCPTVIGSGAGVCRYLRERFPGVPFVELDPRRFYAGLAEVEDLLLNYDRRRYELEEALRAADFAPRRPHLTDIYQADAASDTAARAECDDWDRRLASIYTDGGPATARLAAAA